MKPFKLFLVFFIAFSVFFSELLFSQDMHFSQFNQSPLSLNPAEAGTTAWIRGIMQYRRQWGAITTPYKTIGASFDIKSKKRWIKVKRETEKYRKPGDNGFGWGVCIYNDRAGDGNMNTLLANGSIAYQIMVGQKSMIAAAFQGGILQRSINFNELQFGSQYDQNAVSTNGYNKALPTDKAISNGSSNFIAPDLSTGIIYTYKKNERYMRGNDQMNFTLGAALFHFTSPRYSYLGTNEILYRRMVFHGNGLIGISNTSIAIVPGFLFQKQGPNNELFFGTLIRYMLREDSKYTGFIKGSSVSAGGYYRNKDAFIATALFEFSSYGIGISYDFNVSALKTVSYGRGGFEITLRFMNPSPFIFSQASFSK